MTSKAWNEAHRAKSTIPVDAISGINNDYEANPDAYVAEHGEDIKIRIEGLEHDPDERDPQIFVLKGVHMRHVDFSAIENILMAAKYSHREAVDITEEFANDLRIKDLAKILAERIS